jgi:hypothetical protein
MLDLFKVAKNHVYRIQYLMFYLDVYKKTLVG